MNELSEVSKTLYVPLIGRAVVTKNFPEVFHDEAALKIVEEHDLWEMTGGLLSEYTYIASAVRSWNIDMRIRKFLTENRHGVVVSIGCGLETFYERNDFKEAQWYQIDLENVIQERWRILGKNPHDQCLPYSMFDSRWHDEIRIQDGQPVLFIASGLFYYFQKKEVVAFINSLNRFHHSRIIFDAVSRRGLKRTLRYMEKMNKGNVGMYFSLDRASDLAELPDETFRVTEIAPYYRDVKNRRRLSWKTRMIMSLSDLFSMVKMVQVSIA